MRRKMRARIKNPTMFPMGTLTQNSIMFLNAIGDENARIVQSRLEALHYTLFLLNESHSK